MMTHPKIEDHEIEQALRDLPELGRPDTQHINGVRELLLQHTTGADIVRPVADRPKRKRSVLKLGVAAAVAACVAVIVLPNVLRSQTAFAAVIMAKVRQQTWVHTVSLMEQNGEQTESEGWFSRKHRIAAVKMPQLIQLADFKTGLSMRYKPDQERMYKVRAEASMEAVSDGLNFADSLLDEAKQNSLFPGCKVFPPKKSTVTINGRAMTQYSFRVEKLTDSNRHRRVELRIDPQTELLTSWEERHSTGMRIATRFEYPLEGPADIYALGVPKSAEVIDRVANSDVTKIAAAYQKGRVEFDDYDAIFVQQIEGRERTPSHHDFFAQRVRRSGNRYRVDNLLRATPELEAPAEGADMTKWWTQNRDKFWSVPVLVCDGKTITTYQMVDGNLPKSGKPNLAVELRMNSPVNGLRHDPMVAWTHLMPEHSSRPHLWTTDDKRSFQFEPTPDDGPDGSVLIVVNHDGDKPTPERGRLWCDPNHGFCVAKNVQPVFSQDKLSIAYVDTEEFSNFVKSPSGFWYPANSRRTTGNDSLVQVREYHLDFDAQLNDELFQPLELTSP